eukprot:TRINITY_DN10147_c0_g1_i1.p1 TRINITY_DN10147_c0_g1~~TRINITY_DN10147_c0_g1_i1.p1  ORF type:complete len:155 (-),score=46.99 TRINITY_DN10147_c0_g1_i1:32-496(-)
MCIRDRVSTQSTGGSSHHARAAACSTMRPRHLLSGSLSRVRCRACTAPPVAPRFTHVRSFVAAADLNTQLNEFQGLFVEAREILVDANESIGTKYIEDDLEDAQAAVKDAVGAFDKLISGLDEQQKTSVMQANGLKVEQLKGELQLIIDKVNEH